MSPSAVAALPSRRTQVSPDEWQLRVDLAAAYRLVALFKWDDLVFTHISARVPGPQEHFLINPYGLMFEEITASSLIKIDLQGNKIEDSPYPVNPAGFTIHSAVHAARAARATERADIAAHLHDSVLQTLALIQRQSGDAAAVTRLARAQERELRTWLYDGPQGSQSTLAAAVTEVAHEVEDLHGQVVDLVVTGDRPYEPHGAALTQALREALLNAVRHGRAPVTAYVEIGPSGVEAFVRDRGTGFDLDDVPADRLGVRQSILGRMERHGGSARVRRRDDGTEVELRLPPLQGEQP